MKRLLFLSIFGLSGLMLSGQSHFRFFQKPAKTVQIPLKRTLSPTAENQWFPPFISATSHIHAGYLPTEFEQTAEMEYGGNKSKFVAVYDSYGHLISEKKYEFNEFTQTYYDIPATSNTYAYQQLPTGEFALVEQTEKTTLFDHTPPESLTRIGEYGHRYTAAYDGKGMMLWEQDEFIDDKETGIWKLNSRMERLNNPSSIKSYDPETKTMNPDNRYTFDSKGRITEFRDTEEDYWYTYTWNNADQITQYTWGEEKDSYTATHIEYAWNAEYLNIYGLDPLGGNSGRANFFEPGFSYWMQDSDLPWRQHYYNATIQAGDQSFQQRVVVSENGKSIVTTISLGEQVFAKSTFTATDEYGSYKNRYEEYEEGELTYWDSEEIEFNSHGALVRRYQAEGSEEDVTDKSSEIAFTRSYDAQQRPTSTVFYENGVKMCTHTYTQWTYVDPSGLPETKTESPEPTVFLNPESGILTLSTPEQVNTLAIYHLTGELLLTTGSTSELNLSALPSGMYLVRIRTIDGKDLTERILKY